MNDYGIEVEYIYEGKTSWMYFFERRKKLETALEYAKKGYESQIRSLGWGKRAKIVDVRPIRNVNEKIPHRVITPDTDSRKRKPSPRKPVQRRNSARTKKADAKPKPATADSKKPRKNRRNAGRSESGTQNKPSTSRRRSTSTRTTKSRAKKS